MRRRGYSAALLLVLLLLGLMIPGAVTAEPAGKLIIFHAGSLTIPFAKIEKE